MTDAPIDEFMAMVQEHQASLRAFTRMLGVAGDWVDDVAQETFLVAYRHWDQFDRSRGAAPWLRGIARKIIANERRKEARHSRILHDYVSEVMAEAVSDEVPALETREMVSAMNACLEALPEKSRRLLRCRYENDENAVELSRRLSVKSEAIRQALMRIRIALLQCIQGKLGAIEP